MAAHKGWRISANSVESGTILQVDDLIFKLSGIDQSTSQPGTAFANQGTATALFDGTTGLWSISSGLTFPAIAGFVFTTPIDADSYDLKAFSSSTNRMVTGWDIEYSDDTTTGLDGTWTTFDTVSGESTWSASEIRNYTPPPPGHLAWRIFVSTNNGDGSFIQIEEVEFNLAASDQSGNAGTAYATSSTFAAANAFDDVPPGTGTNSWASGSGNVTNEAVGKAFNVAIDVDEYTLTSMNVTGGALLRLPQDFELQYSDDVITNQTEFDNATWTTADTRTGETAWVAAEVRAFPLSSPSTVGVVGFDLAYQQESALTLTGNVGLDLSYVQEEYVVLSSNVGLDLAYIQEELIVLTGNVGLDLAYVQEEYVVLSGNIGLDLSYIQEQLITESGALGLDLAYIQQFADAGAANLTDSMSMQDNGIQVFSEVFRLRENIGFGDDLQGPSFYTLGLSDAISLSDNFVIGQLAALADGITLSESPEALVLLIGAIQEQLTLNDTLESTSTIIAQLTDNMLLADLILSGLIGAISETILVSDTATSLIVAWAQIQEQLTLHFIEGGVGPTVNVLGSISDEITLDDTLTPSQILNILLKDEFTLISLPDNIPAEGRVGWVMAPETFSVWNYNNMNFNSITSFERQGLMANSQGLFKSTGTTDYDFNDPTNIELNSFVKASLKTASLDFGTSSQKQVPQVYLGLDMDGEMTLVVNTDEKVKVRYKLTTHTQHSHVQKIDIGKGLIGSQFQFELINEKSEEFLLNFVEIYPVVFGRKLR